MSMLYEDHSVNFGLLVGINVIQEETLTISATDATLCKPGVEPEKFLKSLVNIVEDSHIDIAHVTDNKLRSQLLLLLQNYALQKS